MTDAAARPARHGDWIPRLVAVGLCAALAGCSRGGDPLARVQAERELDGWDLSARSGDSAIVMTRGRDTLDVRATGAERRERRARWRVRGAGGWRGATVAPEAVTPGRPDAAGAVVEARGGLAGRPDWLPLYPGADARPARGERGPGGAGGGWHFETPDSLAAVVAFHARALEAAGLAVRRAGAPAPQVHLAAASADGRRVAHVLLTARDGGGTGGDVQFVHR